MSWIRVEALLHDHPKVAAMGPAGMDVLVAAWRLCKAQGTRGALTAAFWTPTVLARWTLYGIDRLDEIKAGMDACEAAGLVTAVTRDNRTMYAMHDWDDYQRDATASDRQRRHRERDLTPQIPDPVTRDVTAVTPVTPTGQDTTGQDIEDRRVVSPPPPAILTNPDPPKPKAPPDPFPGALLDAYATVWREKTGTGPSLPASGVRFMRGAAAWLRREMPDRTDDGRLEAFLIGLRNRHAMPKLQFMSTDIAAIMTAPVKP